MRNGSIYIIKNDINNKVYIGQTLQKVKRRWYQHLSHAKSKSTNMLIHRAINKYGKEHFRCEVLESDIPIELINEREEYYIQLYNSLNEGYNMCPGGQKWRREPLLLNENELDIVLLYKDGMSTRDISNMYNVSHITILDLLDRNGVTLRNKECNLPDKSVYIENKEEKLKQMRVNGLSKREIARQLNVNDKSVRRWLKQLNIE